MPAPTGTAGRVNPAGSRTARPRPPCDHWNRVTEDIELLKALNVEHYRMGLEWARVEPSRGEFDMPAIDHYRDELGRLIRFCEQTGVRPLVDSVMSLEQARDGFAKMAAGDLVGKVVFTRP